MKTRIALALALAAGSSALRAQTIGTALGAAFAPAAPSAADNPEQAKAQLLDGIARLRASGPPERFEPRIAELEAKVKAATALPELAECERRFKALAIASLLAPDFRRAATSATAAAEPEKVAPKPARRQAERAAARTETTASRTRSARDGRELFDGGGRGRGAGAGAEAPRATLNHDSRYRRLASIMVSQGADSHLVELAIRESLAQGVDPTMTLSLIWQESRFRAGARSSVGARGLMQVMPATAKDMGVADASSLYDPRTNLRTGIKYLRWAAGFLKLNMNLRDVAKAPEGKVRALLASYNAGVGTVRKWIREQGPSLAYIPYRETRNYVNSIGGRISRLVSAARNA